MKKHFINYTIISFISFLRKGILAQKLNNRINRNFLGDVISENFSNGKNWTVVGHNDFVFKGNLIISGTNTFSYDKYITRNKSTNSLRTYTIEATITVKDISPTSNGLGIGFSSVNISPLSQLIEISFQNGKLSCAMKKLGYYSTRTILTSVCSLKVSINDELKISYRSNDGEATFFIFNATTKKSTIYSFDDTYRNTGKLAIWSLGGTHEIRELSFITAPPIYADILFIGDSQFNNPGSPAKRLGSKFKNYIRYTGSGDGTPEAIQAYKFLQVIPKIVVIEFGINDIMMGYSLETYQSNVNTIIDYFKRLGSIVYVLEIPPFRNPNVPIWNKSNALQGWNIIPIYDLLGNGTLNLKKAYHCGDNIHWSNAGQIVVMKAIKKALLIP